MQLFNILLSAALAATSSAGLIHDNSQGQYHVPCVEISNQCAVGTENLDVYAFKNYDTINRLISKLDEYAQANDTAASLMMYGVLSASGNYGMFKRPNTNYSKLIKQLLHANGVEDVDCNDYSGCPLAWVCWAAHHSRLGPDPRFVFSDMAAEGSFTISCSDSHNSFSNSDCYALVDEINGNDTPISGSPRSLQFSSCYVSWSGDASFPMKNLYNAAVALRDQCSNNGQSGKAEGTHLSGTTVTECLSDRATGCT